MGFSASAQTVANFNAVNLTVPPAQEYAGPGGGVYYNGSDEAGGFSSAEVFFINNFTDFGGGFTAWEGWAYSTTVDVETSGFGNQYSAYAGGGFSGTTYGVSYAPDSGPGAVVTLPSGLGSPLSARITNTTYVALDMLNGSAFSKQFGGPGGDDPDWFALTITGYDSGGMITGSLDFYLADYRFSDNSLDYIIDDWTEVDLTDLGTGVASIGFILNSSDQGDFGMNTPAYFAMDELTLVPETTVSGLILSTVAMILVLRGRKRVQRMG